MPLMLFDQHKVEDLDTSQEDHCCDEIRYMAMQYVIAPIKNVEQKTIFSDPLDMFNPKQHKRGYI
jgi:hypothetical protein